MTNPQYILGILLHDIVDINLNNGSPIFKSDFSGTPQTIFTMSSNGCVLSDMFTPTFGDALTFSNVQVAAVIPADDLGMFSTSATDVIVLFDKVNTLSDVMLTGTMRDLSLQCSSNKSITYNMNLQILDDYINATANLAVLPTFIFDYNPAPTCVGCDSSTYLTGDYVFVPA